MDEYIQPRRSSSNMLATLPREDVNVDDQESGKSEKTIPFEDWNCADGSSPIPSKSIGKPKHMNRQNTDNLETTSIELMKSIGNRI